MNQPRIPCCLLAVSSTGDSNRALLYRLRSAMVLCVRQLRLNLSLRLFIHVDVLKHACSTAHEDHEHAGGLPVAVDTHPMTKATAGHGTVIVPL